MDTPQFVTMDEFLTDFQAAPIGCYSYLDVLSLDDRIRFVRHMETLNGGNFYIDRELKTMSLYKWRDILNSLDLTNVYQLYAKIPVGATIRGRLVTPQSKIYVSMMVIGGGANRDLTYSNICRGMRRIANSSIRVKLLLHDGKLREFDATGCQLEWCVNSGVEWTNMMLW